MSFIVQSTHKRARLALVTLVTLGVTGLLTGNATAAFAATCGNGQLMAPLLGCNGNTSIDTTVITVSTANFSGLWVSETGSGSWGIRADGTDRGVSATGGNTGVSGTSGNTGVSGTGSGNFSAGVTGTGGAYGVTGTSSSGVGVAAQSDTGTALQVSGRATFSTSGTAVVPSGQKKVTVTLPGVTTTDFVLATVQGSGAFYAKSASAGTNRFTVFINKAPTAPATVKVAYFVISAS